MEYDWGKPTWWEGIVELAIMLAPVWIAIIAMLIAGVC
jgi:hypothetical protein